MGKSIINLMDEALGEYLSEHIVRFGKGDQEYAKATGNMHEIAERFEAVSGIFDFDRPSALTEQECRALIEYLHLDCIRDSKAIQFAYVLGYRDCIALQRRYGISCSSRKKEQAE